jgi:hypothetical protein
MCRNNFGEKNGGVEGEKEEGFRMGWGMLDIPLQAVAQVRRRRFFWVHVGGFLWHLHLFWVNISIIFRIYIS